MLEHVRESRSRHVVVEITDMIDFLILIKQWSSTTSILLLQSHRLVSNFSNSMAYHDGFPNSVLMYLK